MIKKTLIILFAAAILTISGCKNGTAQATTTTAAPVDTADTAWDCRFYAEDILYYQDLLSKSEEKLTTAQFESSSSYEITKAAEECREIINKFLALSCPHESIAEQHNNMIAATEKYSEFLDMMDRYAYYVDESQTRTEFTDEEMIEIQEISESFDYEIQSAFWSASTDAWLAAQEYSQ